MSGAWQPAQHCLPTMSSVGNESAISALTAIPSICRVAALPFLITVSVPW